MSAFADRDRGRLAWRLLIVAFGGALCALYVWLAVRNPHVGFLADDALYLLMAEIYSPYREALGPVYEHVRQYSHLPVFYPLVLALAGGGPDHLLPARLANAACMALAWLVCCWWLRGRGVPRAGAFVLTLFCACTPVTLLYVVDLWSEGLFMLLVLLVLAVERALPRRPSLVALSGLGMLVACAMQTRSIGVALVPAVLFGLYRRSPRVAAIWLLALLPMLGVFSLLDMGSAAPSYSRVMIDHYAADPLAAVAAQWRQLAAELPRAARYDVFLVRGVSTWQLPIYALLLLAVARGLWREWRERSVLAVYLLGYLAIALSWPFPEQTDRFLYPLLPLAVLALWRGSEFGVGAAGARMAWLPIALAVVLVAPALRGMASRAMTPVPAAALDSFRSTRYWLDFTRTEDVHAHLATLAAHERAATLVAGLVPAHACVYTMNVHMVLLHGQRPSFLPPRPARMQAGPPWPCAYFLLTADALRGHPAFYPLDSLRTRAKAIALVRQDEQVPDSPPVAILMRVNQ